MESKFAGIVGVVLFILTGILGLAHQTEIAVICLVLGFVCFWISSNAKT